MDSKLNSTVFRLQGALPVVRSLGHTIFDPIWAQKIHTTPASELQFVIRGSVRVHTRRWSYTAKPGDVIYIPINTPHRDEFNFSTGLEVFMVFFKWEMEHEYLKAVSPRAVQNLSPSARAEISRVFDRLRAGAGGSSKADQLVMQVYVLTILLIILRDICRSRNAFRPDQHSRANTRHREWIMRQAGLFLENHYHEPVLLDDIAHAIGVSPFYLSHVFSEESDFSLFSYLTELRMNKARDLLAQGRLNVAETARAVGYQDSNYFSKVFHKHFGVAPKRTQGS